MHAARVEDIEERPALTLPILIEGELMPAGPPGMVGRRRVEVFAKMLIEDHRLGRQPVEMRRFNPVIAAAAKKSRMEVVEGDDHSPPC